MNEQFHPEERLLKIIEKSDSQPEEVDREIKIKRLNIDVKRWFLKFKDFRFQKFTLTKPTLSLDFAKKVLIAVAALLTLFVVIDIMRLNIRSKRDFQSITEAPVTKQRRIWGETIPMLELNTMLKQVEDRNIFTLRPVPKVDLSGQIEEIPPLTADSYSLVGILWSNNPQAMIEDSISGRTYLVSAGETIGAWKIKKIFSTKVLLESEEGDVELR